MTIRVEECYFDWDKTIDKDGSLIEAEIPYLVFGVTDEDAALAAVLAKAPKKLKGMAFAYAEIDSRINADTFKVRAVYAESEDNGDDDEETEPEPTFAFDTSGGTMHRNQSIKTVSKFPEEAPDFNGAIGVDNEGNINGVDVTMPVLNFTETHTFRASKVTTGYKKTIASLTGTMNGSRFRGFEAGEVLFLGASGSRTGRKSDDDWEITFRFAVSPNQKTVKIGDITVEDKYGWDYLWVRYADKVAENKKNVIKKPVAAYLERVYETGDFGNLGLGN